MEKYDVVIPISYKDIGILKKNLPYIIANLEYRRIVVVGNQKVFDEIKLLNHENVVFMDEDNIFPDLSFSKVSEILKKRCNKTRRTGWYLQQFIKLAYSYKCEDEYYLVWDADTIPLRKIDFLDHGKALFNLKDEYNKPYFKTIETLFAVKNGKVEKKSFISEHMLFNKKIVIEMLEYISNSELIYGNNFYEKVLYSIKKSNLNKSGFSEFETYGTYCLLFHKNDIKYRDLSTLRYGKRFLGDNPSDEALRWASKDYDTISFEKFDRPSKKVSKYVTLDFMENHSLKEVYNKNKCKLLFYEKIRRIIRNLIR